MASEDLRRRFLQWRRTAGLITNPGRWQQRPATAHNVRAIRANSLEPGWAYQWHGIQRHLARLREQYQGINTLGNVDVEQNVHSLFLGLFHLSDWLHQDSALSLSESMVRTWINQHPDSLGLCRDYANTWKHMKRNQSGARIAQITRIESGSNGQKVTIGFRPHDQPNQPMTEVDGLELAGQSEQDWRDFLRTHGISIPT